MAKTNAAAFLGIDDLRALFKTYLNISIKRSSVYFYIREKGFPESTGWGCPRQWDGTKVKAWFESQKSR